MHWRLSLVAMFLAALGPTGAAMPGESQARTALEGEWADFVVAQDGSGDFRTIQEAIDAVPADNATNCIILIRSGTYREKVFITRSCDASGAKAIRTTGARPSSISAAR